MSDLLARRKIHITGIVQGVGFRPFVYNLARRHGLRGWVLNSSAGVDIEAEGPASALDAFVLALQAEKPPLAVIDSLSVREAPPNGYVEFTIRHSQSAPGDFVPISPDICICDDCLRELFDPSNRRYGYPFINCTNCGPRFTIIQDIPYDRPLTTMAAFKMCAACQAEYDDPADRRFHAQPNACPQCGPSVRLEIRDLRLEVRDWRLEGGDWTAARRDPESPTSNFQLPISNLQPIAAAQDALRQGAILAVKGLGGFHLACDATNDAALRLLRERKGRVDKPFALMAFDVATVERFCWVSDEERALLESRERPILLLRERPDSPIARLAAPGNPTLGVMLPYAPLHYLLLADGGRLAPAPDLPALVMTSGNYSEEPIVKDNDEALTRLSLLADVFLLHNRDIHARCDDSVVRVHRGKVLPVRRSRGYAPFPVKLPFPVEPTLAVGGELKNTFCLTRDDYAFMSQHIGDMENYETLQAFEQGVAHFCSLFRVQPRLVAHDMHPEYLSTKWARGQIPNIKYQMTNLAFDISDLTFIPVQHHHAHIAACMAEHGLSGDEPVIGVSFDGTGYGPDPDVPGGAAIWGGEVLVADYADYRRAAHLAYVPLPGGDSAIRKPYRTALAHLWAAGVEWDPALAPVAACDGAEQGVIRHQLETGFNAVPTSSMGRLFDAAAAIAGVRQTVTYEAQAALEFEALAAEDVTDGYRFEIESASPACFIVQPAPVIRAVVADARAGLAVPVISARFHNAVAGLVRDVCVLVREREGLARVALSGGVFQNVTLLAKAERLLAEAGFDVLIHRAVPPNDGGIALGQAVVANVKYRK